MSSIMLEYDSIWLSTFQPYFISLLLAKLFTFLLYPSAGLIAETVLTRFKVMIIGSVVATVGIILSLISLAVDALLFYFTDYHTDVDGWKSLLQPGYIVPLLAGIIIHYVGLSLFEANAIQFGTDQLQFASNNELSKFVHWYFWTSFAVQYTFVSLSSFTGELLVSVFPLLLIALIGAITLLFLIYCCRHHLFTEPVGHTNPVKLVAKVLSYIKHHKQPVRRSAFTYGEVPSKMDIAKERYGGPFTTEQVQDVKSFCSILTVLLSMFGLMTAEGALTLSSDVFFNYYLTPSYSGDEGFHNIASTTLTKLYFYSVIIVGLPIYMCLIRPLGYKCPSLVMLKRIGIGLLMIVVTLVITTVYSGLMFLSYEHNNGTECFSNETIYGNLPDVLHLEFAVSLLLIISQIINGLGYILVFLTSLEFILAQSPRSMQGLLIGIWYGYQSIGVAVRLVSVLTLKRTQCSFWPYAVKTVLAIISLVMFVLVSRWYNYRERDEYSNINQRAVIEEYTERQLLRRPINDNIEEWDDVIIKTL